MTQGIALYRQAVALDPVNPRARSFLAFNLALTGQFAEAQAEYPRVVELIPAAPWAMPVSVSPFFFRASLRKPRRSAGRCGRVGPPSHRGHGPLESETHAGSRCRACQLI